MFQIFLGETKKNWNELYLIMMDYDEMIARSSSVKKDLFVVDYSRFAIHSEHLIMLRHAKRLPRFAVLWFNFLHFEFASTMQKTWLWQKE